MATDLKTRMLSAIQAKAQSSPAGVVRSAYTDDLARGGEAEDLFFDRARTFNPYESVNRAATGAFNSFRRTLGRDVKTLRGQQVGMGRLDTGFATDDEDELVLESLDRLNDEILRNSMSATQLELANNQGIGAYGGNVRTRGLDLLSAERDRETAEKNAKRQSKSGLLGGLARLAGGAIGTVLGPVGSAAGAHLAGKLFNSKG